MEKLVFRYSWGCSGTCDVPFEYKSKDDFIFDVLENKDYTWSFYRDSDYDSNRVEIFEDIYLSKGELNDIEHNVYTIDDWFKTYKVEPTKLLKESKKN